MNLLKKIFSPTILTISFLFLIFTFYKSEIIWDGTNRNYYKTYYIISSILICFSVISFFINNIIKEYLIISGFTLVVSLYLFEGYIIYKEKKIPQKRLYEKQTGIKWDSRSPFEIYKDLKKKNNKITIEFNPSYLVSKNHSSIPLPLSGQSNSETIQCNENGYYSIFQSDRYGFNNPDNEWEKKEIEYLLVGDSFTFGDCVNRPNDISSVLRDLSNRSVLNLGIGGNGPLMEYATLREYLNENVKKVLWLYYEGNDLVNLEDEKKNNILVNYLKDLDFTQNLKLKQNEIDSLISNIIIKERERKVSSFEFKLKNFLKIYRTRNLFLHEPPATPPEFKKILQLTKDLIKKNNAKLYFVYLPEYNRYKTNFDNTSYNYVKNTVNELKIPFIDIHKEVFEKEQNPKKLFPFEMFGHYTIDGYKKVSETIYKFTKD